MIVLKILLTSIHVIISVLLVVVILLQASKGGGLSGTFGGQATGAIFGQRSTATLLSTLTQYLAGGFLVLSLVLSLLAGAGNTPVSVTQQVLESTPAMNLPAVEDLSVGGATGEAPEDAPSSAPEPIEPSATPTPAPAGGQTTP